MNKKLETYKVGGCFFSKKKVIEEKISTPIPKHEHKYLFIVDDRDYNNVTAEINRDGEIIYKRQLTNDEKIDLQNGGSKWTHNMYYEFMNKK